jgi:hypothetical protein
LKIATRTEKRQQGRHNKKAIQNPTVNRNRKSNKRPSRLGVALVVISIAGSPLHLLIYAVIPVLNATSCQNRHRRAGGANYTNARRLNDGIDEKRIPGNLLITHRGKCR